MNDLIIIFIVIFILILLIGLFALIYYMNDRYISYTNEVKDNLTKSEQVMNDTSRAFNKLQDNVINKLATVDDNQDKIVNTSHRSVRRLNSNLTNVFDFVNNGNIINDISRSNIDTTKSYNINVKPDITTYKNVSSLTDSSRFINICDANTDASKRKCVNVNIDNDGIFNIYTKNKLNANSNISGIAIRDNNNDVMAYFDGANKNISLGSNISPAISITSNVYTPDIIICNYTYTKPITNSDNSVTPGKINLTFISNFDIKPNSFINFIIPNENINTVSIGPGYTSGNFSNNSILKLQYPGIISKNTINNININVVFKNSEIVDITTKFNTNGFITLS
jgi:hypothetical protein